MKQSGCHGVSLGLESMSPRILKLMGKMHNPSRAIKVLKVYKKYRIKTHLSVMFGFPTETKEEAEETLKFLVDNKNLYHSISTMNKFILNDDMSSNELRKKLAIPINIKSRPYTKRMSYGRHEEYYDYIYKYKKRKGMSEKELKDILLKSRELLKDKF